MAKMTAAQKRAHQQAAKNMSAEATQQHLKDGEGRIVEKPPKAGVDLALVHFKKNKAKNTATRASDKARDNLIKWMEACELSCQAALTRFSSWEKRRK